MEVIPLACTFSYPSHHMHACYIMLLQVKKFYLFLFIFRKLKSLESDLSVMCTEPTLNLSKTGTVWMEMYKRKHTARRIPTCHFMWPASNYYFNPLNAELNPICHLLALLGLHHFLHVSRIRVKSLTLRLLMSYIYIYLYIYIYTEHLFLMFLDHTQRRSTVGRTPLDEWSARLRDLYLTTHDTHNRQISMPPVGFEPTISAGERPHDCAASLCVI